MTNETSSSTSERRLAWMLDVLAVLYFAWTYFVLSRQTAGVVQTLRGLGVEAPRPTAFVMAHHAWLYAVGFGGAALLVVSKEFWVRDKRLSAGLTFLIALGALWLSDAARAALFEPLLTMIERLA